MPSNIKKQIAEEILEALDDNNLRIFSELLDSAVQHGVDFNAHYGSESGYKTILHLALEEDDGLPYVEDLIQAGASTSHYNSKIGSAPIHVAAQSGYPDFIRVLIKGQSSNRADVNVPNKDGLTAFHILLAKLLDLAVQENKSMGQRKPKALSDEQLEEEIIQTFLSLQTIADSKDLRLDFDNPVYGLTAKNSTLRKLSSMTVLQILCSFQSWNAKNISKNIHELLEKLVITLLEKGVDPNATGAKNALPGTVPGSTPPVLLAATRGYYKVVENFKKYYNTNFLLENKFQQTILHVVLKAGYYNKIIVHGEDAGFVNIKTIYTLFADNNLIVQQQMRSIINRTDSNGNTALHYARTYPDQSVVKFLLGHGAKIDINQQQFVNINPRTLEEYFYESCIRTEGEDIDDEEFKIRLNFKLFEKPVYKDSEDFEVAKERANAWAIENDSFSVDLEKPGKASGPPKMPSSGKLDTKRLEYFSDVNSLHILLKHPFLSALLEMELNSLKIRYFIDFFFFLLFAIVLFTHLGNKYGLFKVDLSEGDGIIFTIKDFGGFSYYAFILFIFIVLLIFKEIYQMIQQKKKYFTSMENYVEWFVIVLVTINIIPKEYYRTLADGEAQRHLAAICLLIVFMQLYLLLVRVVPNTPIPLYINMFTTVLKSYTFILLCYMAFIISFAYSFFLIFGYKRYEKQIQKNNSTNQIKPASSETEDESEDTAFGNIGYSLVKTIVMFIGEMDYTDLEFEHWLGYVIFVLFAFLLVIVLMNILNGLAVSDINKIQDEVDTYYHISIVETLAATSFVSLQAEEVIIYPNVKPAYPKILGIPIPGFKVYPAKGGKEGEDKPKMDLTFSENTVKATKELVALKQQQSQVHGAKVTMENLADDINDIKREQSQLKGKLNDLDDNIRTILDIMASRQPKVERL